MNELIIRPGKLTHSELRQVIAGDCRIRIDESCWEGVEASAAVVQAVVEKGDPAYGINTGFGKLAKVKIDDSQLSQLQTNLVRSHAVGVGSLLDDSTVRLILVLKIASLARGFSGVRRSTLERLVDIYNAGICPCIPGQGSVGASGDLAPLAHLSLTLIGEGECRVMGETVLAAGALEEAGIEPVVLGAKEGLALLNGTQVSTAIALRALWEAEEVFGAAVVAGALSVDAAKGSDAPFDARIHEVRGHAGQIELAANYRKLLAGSEIRASHLEDDDRVQDPYSLRCQPQVMGPCLEVLQSVARTLLIEANAVSDNPLVYADTGVVLSGGNFHAEPVAIAADTLAIAIAEIGALSERRVALLIDSSLSGLPAFLVKEAGLNSGFMIAHVTAAALASENKTLAHPASVDSLPTSANQEDHVSMATFASRKVLDIARNVRHIIAIEILAAVQGIEFHRPLKSSSDLEELIEKVRERVPSYEEDRVFTPDIEAIENLIAAGVFSRPLMHSLPTRGE